METLAAQIANLQYAKFKATVRDRARHDADMDVWAVMNRVQR